jgi:hypothetical protein
MGLCPSCQAPIREVRLEAINVQAAAAQWVGVSYLCPYCSVVLGAGIDPIAIKTDIVEEIVRQLRRR